MPDMSNWTNDQVAEWLKEEVAKAKLLPDLPSVDGQVDTTDSAKADRIRALELGGGNVPRAASILSFIQGESTPTLIIPLHTLLAACYSTFLAQDIKDHVAVFDRVTTMRDAYGGVLRAMDELGIHRDRAIVGNVPGDGSEGKSNG